MTSRITVAFAVAFIASLVQAQDAPQLVTQLSHRVKKRELVNITTSLPPPDASLDGALGNVEIRIGNQPAGVLPAAVRVQNGTELLLIEYVSGRPTQTFRCYLGITGTLPQAVVAIGDDKNGFDDVLAGVFMKNSTVGFELRFDKRIRIANGKMGLAFMLGPVRGFAEVLFDSMPPGATLLIPQYGITATTPATVSLKYREGDTIHAFMKRNGSFDAPVTLNFETDGDNVDWLVTGDGRYAIPASPTAPIARIVALFEAIASP
jgi:hypothetical protein